MIKDRDSRAAARKIAQVRKQQIKQGLKSKYDHVCNFQGRSGERSKTQVTTSQKCQGHPNTVEKKDKTLKNGEIEARHMPKDWNIVDYPHKTGQSLSTDYSNEVDWILRGYSVFHPVTVFNEAVQHCSS